MIKKIMISLSGGIDSSFCAFFLKKIKYHTICYYLENNIKNENKFCGSEEDIIYCYKICRILKIKLKIINSNSFFYKKIFLKLLKKYKKGLSYNPDIYCNFLIKFNFLIKKIKKKKFFRFAFGHYAISNGKNLMCSLDKNKDQTYFLYKIIINKYFSKFFFPLGMWKKKLTKHIVNFLNFPNYKRKSSKGICFINNINFGKFIKKYIKSKGKIYINETLYYKKYINMYYMSLNQRIRENIINKRHYIYKKKK
ncbi:hypothetical protein ACWNYI_00625 [Candidatus Vidania fulgoroideorum]